METHALSNRKEGPAARVKPQFGHNENLARNRRNPRCLITLMCGASFWLETAETIVSEHFSVQVHAPRSPSGHLPRPAATYL